MTDRPALNRCCEIDLSGFRCKTTSAFRPVPAQVPFTYTRGGIAFFAQHFGNRQPFIGNQRPLPLANDPALQPHYDSAYLRWALNDSRVSFLGRRWGMNPDTGEWTVDPETGEPLVVEIGLYVVDLDDDVAETSGAVSPWCAQLEFPTLEDSWPDVSGIDWSRV